MILHFDAGVYYGLDKVGARAWELLADPITIGGLAEKIVAEFDVERDRCERDLENLARDLHEANLIEIVSPDAS